LSSVALNLETAGYEAAALLDGLMSGRVHGYHEVLVKPRLVIARRSTDVVAQDDRIVTTALRFIHDNAGRPIQVPDVVAHTKLSRRSLERRFAAAIGRTPLEELTRCRLDRAKRLLLETDLSTEQVALAAGFSATKRMTCAFRQFEDTLPHRYRQMHD
jgi:LacI family transcriptional regulator